MENAVDALKIAFAIFVFVLAIGIAFTVFSLARSVSDDVLYYTDKTNFEQYVPDSGTDHRVVGLETVVSSIRRYVENNEGYSVKLITENPNKEYNFDLIQDQKNNLTPKQTKENVENALKEIIKKYKNDDVKFKEYFKAEIYRGARYVDPDNGDSIEQKNTDEKVEITYVEL